MSRKCAVRVTEVTEGASVHRAQITIEADPNEVIALIRSHFAMRILTRGKPKVAVPADQADAIEGDTTG